MKIEISPVEYERKLNWYDGKLYCSMMVIDGKDDWRLPTKEELDYIYHSDNDFVGSLYWSSSEDNGGYDWVKNMSGGGQEFNGYKNISYYVRAVRNI